VNISWCLPVVNGERNFDSGAIPMSAVLQSLPSHRPRTAGGVLAQVNALVSVLRTRAPETERLRRMHPDTLRELTEAGVFRLAMPTDVGGYEADEDVIAEVLAQISRGCPSTGWMCTIMLVQRHSCAPGR
jgi:3-hydroxy-9,10-secoandrosta-1,3,5(10)-triene-9,17-dione monooxygenase